MKPFFDRQPKLRKIIKKFNRSVYFSIEDYPCPEGCLPRCKSRMKAFISNNGSLVKMIEPNKVGNGGFGNVYKGKWHGEKVAFKCVSIDLGRTFYSPQIYPQFLRFEKEREEFRKPFSLSGPGILKPVAFFRQQHQVDEGEKTKFGDIWWRPRNYNVYVYPLYDCNLYELHNDYHDSFTDEILKHILSQCLKSVVTLFMNSSIHNDIKPQNFLVRFTTKEKDLMKTEIVLTDFGLTDSLGGTPIFASPEVGFTIDTCLLTCES